MSVSDDWVTRCQAESGARLPPGPMSDANAGLSRLRSEAARRSVMPPAARRRFSFNTEALHAREHDGPAPAGAQALVRAGAPLVKRSGFGRRGGSPPARLGRKQARPSSLIKSRRPARGPHGRRERSGGGRGNAALAGAGEGLRGMGTAQVPERT